MKVKEYMKISFYAFGLLYSLALSVFLYILFLVAYSSPSKAGIFYINRVGEANLEFVLLPIFLAIIIGANIFAVRKILAEMRQTVINGYEQASSCSQT